MDCANPYFAHNILIRDIKTTITRILFRMGGREVNDLALAVGRG